MLDFTHHSRGPMDHVYQATLEKRKIAIFASSMKQARDRAIEHFRATRSKIPLIKVELYTLNEPQKLIL